MGPSVRSLLSCVFLSSQVAWATRIQATRLPSGSSNAQKERGQERKLNNYSTKIYEGVPIIVKDVEYTEPDNVRGNYEWPVTLPPKLLKDGFQIQPTKTGELSPVTKTEYSTFTYLVTKLGGDGSTRVETDIVVSSNVVTTTGGVEPTPVLAQQIQSTSFEAPPSGYLLMQTKTYFTTSTFFTTYIDKDRTITKTRTNVRSSVLTETYSGGQFDYLPGPDQTSSPTIEESPQEKYLSLGPNIYGLVKTLYTTFTYFNGVGKDSREVITQTSTSFFSTTALPASISIAPSPPLPPISASASVQLDRDTLLSLKQQFLASQGAASTEVVQPSFTATYAPDTTADTAATSTPGIPDTALLSSIKDSLGSETPGTSTAASQSVETDVNVPSSDPGNTVIRPSATSTTQSSTTSVLATSSPPDPTPDTSSEEEEESSDDAGNEALAGGLLGAVAGGIATALLPPQPPPSGIQVDLGPVLDAVATLLRGPIRSAIANRRNTAAQNTDRRDGGATATPPQFARLPAGEPNVIPVGGYTEAAVRDPQYGFIPLNSPQQQALPRSDTGLEAEGNYNDINEIPEDILNILESGNNGGDNPIVIDKDKIVINDHIIKTTDPHIIDVLNAYEHSYLYNKETKDPLKIRIAAGGEVPKPQPVANQQPTKIFGITLPKLNIGGIGQQKKKPPPSRPQQSPNPNSPPPRRPKPPPPRRPPVNAPPPNGKRPYSRPPPVTSTVIKNTPVKYKPNQPVSNGYQAPPRPAPGYGTRPAPGPSSGGQPPRGAINNQVSNSRPVGGSQGGSYAKPFPSNVNQPPRGAINNQISNSKPFKFPSSNQQQQYSSGGQPPRGSFANTGNPAGGSYNINPPPVAPPPSVATNQINIKNPTTSSQGGSYKNPSVSVSNPYGPSPRPPATYQNQNSFSPNVNPFNEAISNSNKYPQSNKPPPVSVIDSSVNQIPGSNQWSTYGPGSGQTQSSVTNGYKDNGNPGQGQLKTPVYHQVDTQSPHTSSPLGSHTQHGVSSTLNNDDSNLEDSLSSVSEHSKVVMAAPPGMIEDDVEGHFETQGAHNPKFDPSISHAQHNNQNTNLGNTNFGTNSVKTNDGFGSKFPSVPSRNPPATLRPVPAVPRPPSTRQPSSFSRTTTRSSATRRPPPPQSSFSRTTTRSSATRRPPSPQSSFSRTTTRPSPTRRPAPTRRPTSRPSPPRRTTARTSSPRRVTARPAPTRRTTFRPQTTRRSFQNGISRRPSTGGNKRKPSRPNEVAIDVPAFAPNENAVLDPFGQVLTQQQSPGAGDVLRNQHNAGTGPPPPRRRPGTSNPYRSRQSTSELSATVIQGGNQIIGNGGGIVIGTPSQGFMRDVTITGTDGSTAVIQTRYEGAAAPDLDPSFTVSAGYSPSANTEIYKIERTKESPLFTLVKPSSNKNYEYEGWLTDGDPLKNLPPLRPTSTLDIQVVETEAPKTVTYQNEWQTPSDTPTADFVPVRPPPPASNFDREWKTYKTGQVETVGLIRPTNTLDIRVQPTEAPKTVTYQNEWFANSASVSAPAGSHAQHNTGQSVGDTTTPASDVVPDFVRKNPYSTFSPRRTPRPSRPKYRPKNRRPIRPPVATIEKASVNDNEPLAPTRKPFRNRPTRKPVIRRPTASAEIITGGVRVPPRPPQTYDPFAEYQDKYPELVNDNGDDYTEVVDKNLRHSNHGIRNKPVVLPVIGRPNSGANNYELLLQNAVKNGIADKVDVVATSDDADSTISSPNIQVSSDGYNGYKDINAGYPDKDPNSAPYNDQLIRDGGSGLNEYPPFVTTARTSPGPAGNKTYHSSEYVNEKRYTLRRKPIGTNSDAGVDDGNDAENAVFSPTRRPSSQDSSKDESDGRKSSGSGEIDLHNFFDSIKGEDKSKKKRKFETSTRNTFSTRGKPTFINVDLSTTAAVPINDDTVGGGEAEEKNPVIVTTPIKIVDERTTSQIRPISSSSRPLATLSGTVTAKTSPIVSSIKIGGFKFPPRPRPDISYKAEEEIKDDEVLNKNVEAAIVEQVPEHILSAEDQDPQTKCAKQCGENEMCHVTSAGDTRCRCRPGFGKPTNLPGAKCEKSMMYQIEFQTTSESEETRIVRFNPKVLQKALDKSFENKIKDLYHHSEITSIKVNNNSKRNFDLGTTDNMDRDSKDDMKIKLLVQVADENVGGREEEERIRSLIEPTLKETNLPLGSDVMVSRVTIDDFDECSSAEYNDCSNKAACTNTKGSYNCTCMPGYLDITPASQLPGRLCSGASTECELCNRNGQCVLDSQEVSCNCNPWFAGKNCQINLKLLLIVGAVSVCLMMIIACGVSCFCCRDRRKKPIPVPYGVSMARLPPNVRQHSMMMDPSGTVKSAMSGRSRQQVKRHAGPGPGHGHPGHPPLGARNSGPWQDGFGSVASRSTHVSPARGSHVSGAGSRSHSRGSKPALVIPRAKVTPSRGQGYSNNGYHSDTDDRFSSQQGEKNRAMSEVESQGSRHRRRSVPSFASSLLGGAGRGAREGSVDPLLEGFQSDGGDSQGTRHSHSTFHRSVSRGDLDAMDRAETRSVARSFNETIIRPVTRRLQSAAGSSAGNRSNRSTRTSEDGRTMAEKDGGSSFVVSPRQQLYRLHDSDGSFESL